MPRVKSDGERGWIGVWLRKNRIERDWSPEQVVERLDVPIRVDYYRGLEAGRRPGPELLARFEGLYGPVPPEPQDTPAVIANGSAIVMALAAQTAAIEKQTLVLDRLLAFLGGEPARPGRVPLGPVFDEVERGASDLELAEEVTPQDAAAERASPVARRK